MTGTEFERACVWFSDQMVFLYGKTWTKALGELGGQEFELWRKLLAQLTKEQIKIGVKRMDLRESEYPPTRQAFKRAATEVIPASHRQRVPCLPRSTMQERREHAASGLAKARSLLGNKIGIDGTQK